MKILDAKQLRKDIPEMLIKNDDQNGFINKYGQSMWVVVVDNFILPIFDAHVDDQDSITELMESRLNIFCNSFL